MNDDQRLNAYRSRFEVINGEALTARFDALVKTYEGLESGKYTLNLERDYLTTRYGALEVIYSYRYDLSNDDQALEAVYVKRGNEALRLEGFNQGQLFNGLRALRFNDTLIQNALPALTVDQREFIMTGFKPLNA